MDLYCIGEMLIDFIPGKEPDSYIRNAGGAPANVAIAAAKNGLLTGMCCCLGDDIYGHFLMNVLSKYKVRCINKILCKKAFTTLSFVSLSENGEREFAFMRKPGADMFLDEDKVKQSDIKNATIVHGGSCSLSASPEKEATKKALKMGREYNKIVSFDINYRDVMWDGNKEKCKTEIMKILPYVNILKISEEETELLGGELELNEIMKKFNIALIVKTLGANGSKSYYNNKIISVSGKYIKAVDTTGAGDAFWGGFLSYLLIHEIVSVDKLTEDIVQKAMEYGNVSGWLCVQKKGAITALPSREEIERYL